MIDLIAIMIIMGLLTATLAFWVNLALICIRDKEYHLAVWFIIGLMILFSIIALTMFVHTWLK